MPLAVVPPRPATPAFAHVAGSSSRFKAAPTRINPMAARIMAASGTISSTRTAAAGRPLGRVVGILAVLLAAGTLCLAGSLSPRDERASLVDMPVFQPDELLTLGLGDYRLPSATTAAAPELDAHDKFEVARFFMMSAAPRAQTKAPGRPAKRAPSMAAAGD